MRVLSRFRQRLIGVLAIGLPCLLAVVLGVLQYGWIRQAAVTEERRQQEEEGRRTESALLDVRRAVEASFEDLRLAVSLQRTAMGIGAGPADLIAEQALSAWFQQAAFPSLVRGVWVFSNTGHRERTVRVTGPSGKITRSEVLTPDLPPALQRGTALLGRGASADDLRTALGDQGFALIWAALGSSSTSWAALEIDAAAYLATLPHYLKREAPAQRVTVHNAPEGPADKGKSLVFPVPGFWYASLFRDTPDAPSDRSPGAPWFRFPPEDAAAFLSVEFPETGGGIRPWLITNLAVSAVILLVLLAALVGALLVFARMREMRTAEMEFVASISHELRLPITVIRVIGDNLCAGVVRDEARMAKYGDQIRRQTTRLSSMVEGMLLSAGLQSGNLRPEAVLFNPSEAVGRVVEDLSALLEEHRVTVDTGSPEQTLVQGDENGFSLVLRNLLLNAVVHGLPEEGERRVEIRVSLEALLLRLEVSDNGPGIPRKEQKAIFEPFRRTSKTLSEQRPGSGLGLHIARRIARLNEGSLSVSSPYTADGVLRRGCRFTAVMNCETPRG